MMNSTLETNDECYSKHKVRDELVASLAKALLSGAVAAPGKGRERDEQLFEEGTVKIDDKALGDGSPPPAPHSLSPSISLSLSLPPSPFPSLPPYLPLPLPLSLPLFLPISLSLSLSPLARYFSHTHARTHFHSLFCRSLTTYKELCTVATELGQPELIYKFLNLAGHQKVLPQFKIVGSN